MNNKLKTHLPFYSFAIIAIFIVTSFTPTKNSEISSQTPPQKLDIQGHRGARGLYPENTVTAFIEAVKLGVNTLEMDVIVSKDSQLVVSHEAWMSDEICTKPNGELVEKDAAAKYNLYKMNYAEIKQYDCGMRVHPRFLTQKKLPEHKPLLSEVITKVEAFIKENKLPPIIYSIETKSEPKDDGIFNPAPKTFVRLLYTELKKQNILNRIIIQSFDVRTLQELRKVDPKIKTSFLVENTTGLKSNLAQLGFDPTIYSPDFNLINDTLVKDLHQKNILLIPWTVDEISDMKRLVNMGVDGIITDYPDRAINLFNKK